MKSVLHIINGDLYSGAERVQDLLALRLKELDYTVSFVCIKPGIFSEHRQSKDSTIYNVHMKSKFDLLCGFKIAKIIKNGGYDLIHTHTPRTAMVGRIASILTCVPMVHHVHSPTARDTESPVRNKINTLIEKISLLGVSKLIPVSLSLASYLKQQGYKEKLISPVFNGVPTPGNLLEVERPAGVWTIGTVALFRPRKGLEILLEAISILKKKNIEVRLRAVGPFETPEYEKSIQEICDKFSLNEVIDWTGFCSDVNSEFSNMDIFILPSMFGEGMPMVILEAMAMGVPVIASDVEGIPQVLNQAESGLIVPPNDSQALAGSIEDLIDEKFDWQKIRKNAYDDQVNKYSDFSMAKGVADVYDSVLLKNE